MTIIRAGERGATTHRGRFANHDRTADDISLGVPAQLAHMNAAPFTGAGTRARAASAYGQQSPAPVRPMEAPLDVAGLRANPATYVAEVASDGKYLAVYSPLHHDFSVDGGTETTRWRVKDPDEANTVALWRHRHEINAAVTAAGYGDENLRNVVFDTDVSDAAITIRDAYRRDREPIVIARHS